MNKSRQRHIAAVQKAAPQNRVLSYVVLEADRTALLSPTSEVAAALEQEQFQDHECGSCGTRIQASVHTPSPYCACCGSGKVRAVGSVYSRAVAKSDAELGGVECASCGNTHIMHAAVITASAGDVHCTSCGVPLTQTAAADAPGSVEAIDLEDQSTGVTAPIMQPAPKITASEDDSDEGEADDEGSNADDKKKESGSAWPFQRQTAASRKTRVKSDLEEIPLSMGDDEDLEMDADFDLEDDVADVVAADELTLDMGAGESFADPEALDAVSFEDNFGSTPDLIPEGDGTSFMDMATPGSDQRIAPENDLMIADAEAIADLPELADGDTLMDGAELDDTVNACFFVSAGRKLLAVKGHYVVATLTPERAGANAEVMHRAGFTDAVTNEIRTKGMRKALAAYGFNPVRLKVQTAAAVKTQVNAALSRVTAARQAAEKVQADAFAIAAVGLARGMWKAHPNPLRAALVNEFAALGVTKPEAVASRLLASAGIGYSQQLCSVASQLASMKSESRKEFADMLDMVSDVPVADDAMLDEGFDGDFAADPSLMDAVDPSMTVASVRLSRPGVVNASSKVPALLRKSPGRESASLSSSLAQDMLEGRAPLFNF